MLFAGEYSGNIYGAALAKQLKRLCPGIRLTGTGCREMAAAGVELLHDSSSWGGIGFIEALRVFPRLYLTYHGLQRFILKARPQALVLIDFPGFNMFLARLALRLSIPTLYYFPPGKFAREPNEVSEAARIISSIAAPFRFTYDVYSRAGAASVEYVGHPMADVLPLDLTKAEARRRLGLPTEGRVVGLLPGSRRRELRSHTPMLMACARRLADDPGDVRFVVPMPDLPGSKLDGLIDEVERLANDTHQVSGIDVRVTRGMSHETMVAADALIVSSGTATLEALWFETPMAIIYKASWLTEFLARRFFYKKLPDHFGLPNIIAGRLVVPEFIQQAFTEDNITDETRRLLVDDRHRQSQVAELQRLKHDVTKPGTSTRVATMALQLVERMHA